MIPVLNVLTRRTQNIADPDQLASESWTDPEGGQGSEPPPPPHTHTHLKNHKKYRVS